MKKMKKLMSVLLAIALVATSLAGLTVAMPEAEVQAAEQEASATQTEEKIVEKTWVDVDFEDATTVSINEHGQNTTSGTLRTYRGNMQPVSTTRNSVDTKALRYIQAEYACGFVYLGDECKDLSLIPSNGLVSVEAGATYEVSFDFMLDVGQTVYPNDAEKKVTYTELVSELDVGLVLLPEYTSITTPDASTIQASYCKMNCITVAKGIKEDIDWERKTFTYTVPEGTNLETYKYLGLYAINGQRGAVYVDNIQVTQLRKETADIISYNDYNDGMVCSSVWQVHDAMADCYPTFDPLSNSNKVVQYRQSTGQGYIILGSNCSGSNGNDIKADAITAVAGLTYTITFDYLAMGTTGNTGTQVFLFVGSAGGGRTDTNRTQSFKSATPILELSKNADITTNGWIRNYTAAVTIPEDTDLTTNGDKLLLQCQHGTNQACLYIDNVKVTANTADEYLVTDDVNYSADFENVTALGVTTEEKLQYDWGGYYQTSGDVSPQADPLNPENMTLWLPKSRTGHNAIVLGSDYSTSNTNTIRNSGIIPVKGADYKIGFDWYHKQTTRTEQTSIVKIYAAVGRIVVEERGDNTNAKCYWDEAWKTELKQISVQEPTSTVWQSFEATVTIPRDITIPEGYSLVLYIHAPENYNDGVGSLVCFDNVSCKSVSPMSAQITVGAEYSSRIYDKETFNPDTLYPTDEENQKVVKWYKDKNRKASFDCNIEKDDLPINLELYGEYERADAAFAIGDNNHDGKVENEDVPEIRKYLVGNTTLISSDEKADTNGDGTISLKDIVRTKKAISKSISGYHLDYGTGVSEANQELAVSYLGTNDDNTTNTIIFNQSSNIEGYSIYKTGTSFIVNAKDDNNLTAAIMSLKSHIASGRELKDGCIMAFQYIGTVNPGEVEGDKTLEMKLAWPNEQLEDSNIEGEYYLYFTDPHLITKGAGTEIADKKASLTTLSKLFKTYNPSFTLCGGDWLNNNHSKTDATTALTKIRTDMTTLFGEKSYLVVGNHDYNYQHEDGGATSRDNDELTSSDIGAAWSITDNKTYYTFTTQASRFYVFDSGIDWSHSALTDLDIEQIKWFLGALQTNNDSHIVLAPHIIYWNDTFTGVHVATQIYAEISAAYNARGTYEYDGTTYDFSEKTGKVEYMIAGHAHADYASVIERIPVVLTNTMQYSASEIPSANFVFANYTEGKLHIVGTGQSTDRVIDLAQ